MDRKKMRRLRTCGDVQSFVPACTRPDLRHHPAPVCQLQSVTTSGRIRSVYLRTSRQAYAKHSKMKASTHLHPQINRTRQGRSPSPEIGIIHVQHEYYLVVLHMRTWSCTLSVDPSNHICMSLRFWLCVILVRVSSKTRAGTKQVVALARR